MKINAKDLSAKYNARSYQDRLKYLFEDFPEDQVLVTSAFGGTSMILLHLLSKIKPGHTVHFIDTSYHFKETLTYRDHLMDLFGLKVIDVKANYKRNQFTRDNHSWKHNHDLCCFINKVEPLEEIKPKYKVWVSGLLRFQNSNREHLDLFESKPDILKFHPIIDMSKEEVATYKYINELPEHPLTKQGYQSVGCTHCTQKGTAREGRWADVSKTECGLHE
ncbi:MAG: phosphoadenylyl-sulfate reductase [Cyclobacteriaceae bacterium]